MRPIAAALLAFLSLTAAAQAEAPADIVTRHLYAGTLAEGARELDALAAASGDPQTVAEARAGEGMIAFVAGIQKLGQSLYRHGLHSPGQAVFVRLPILRMPVPENPNPAPLNYDGFRRILSDLFDDMTAAEDLLAETGDRPVKIKIDLARVHLDLDGDGLASDAESIGTIYAALAGTPLSPGQAIGFDTADIYWLRAYCDLIGATAEFPLAHDFHQLFDTTFHIFFPRAGLPYGKELEDAGRGSQYSDDAVGDLVAFLHLINWPVTDPARLADVRLRLKAVVAMSRQSWASARAETDNDGEWLPNAHQTGVLVTMPVTDELIDGWLAAMGEFDALLDGRKLLPHWRFTKGINLKRYFTEAKSFDLVLMISGVGALPYLDNGPLTSGGDWNLLTGAFGDGFLSYAVWFN